MVLKDKGPSFSRLQKRTNKKYFLPYYGKGGQVKIKKIRIFVCFLQKRAKEEGPSIALLWMKMREVLCPHSPTVGPIILKTKRSQKTRKAILLQKPYNRLPQITKRFASRAKQRGNFILLPPLRSIKTNQYFNINLKKGGRKLNQFYDFQSCFYFVPPKNLHTNIYTDYALNPFPFFPSYPFPLRHLPSNHKNL